MRTDCPGRTLLEARKSEEDLMPDESTSFLSSQMALEVTAAVEHDRWAHWQRYLHDQCTVQEDGSLIIPRHLVDRWERQISTPYDALSEKEKNSDREQARDYLSALKLAAHSADQ